MATAELAGLSQRLTDTIAFVEMQRSVLEDVILQLAEHATQLSVVSGVLMKATHSQGAMLQELQHLIESSGVDARLGEGVESAAAGIVQAASMLTTATLSGHTVDSGGVNSGTVSERPAAKSSVSKNTQPITGEGANIQSILAAATAATIEGGSLGAAPAPSTVSSAAAVNMSSRQRAATMPSMFARVVRPAVIEPDMDDEGGVEYVKNLVIRGMQELNK